MAWLLIMYFLSASKKLADLAKVACLKLAGVRGGSLVLCPQRTLFVALFIGFVHALSPCLVKPQDASHGILAMIIHNDRCTDSEGLPLQAFRHVAVFNNSTAKVKYLILG